MSKFQFYDSGKDVGVVFSRHRLTQDNKNTKTSLLPCTTSYNLFMLIFLWFIACSASNNGKKGIQKLFIFVFLVLASVRAVLDRGL